MSYSEARERYAAVGVDPDQALKILSETPISMHCWQGDDVAGFENPDQVIGSGLAVTGNYPGKARGIDQLRADFEKAVSLIPGKHRMNLHASYGDFGGQVPDRDGIEPAHFQSWIEWAQANDLGLDFNPTLFSHPKVDNDGLSLSHPDPAIRAFWIEHCKRCRIIAVEMGKQLGTSCVNNIWIPDGMKDMPAERLTYRQHLADSLDAVFADPIDPAHSLDAIECKLFGIGSESFVVGSHEFYLGYAVKNQTVLCLDAGHFHPTESVADKISSVLLFVPEILLHVSRGIRWDSDHVVIVDDPTQAIMDELVRSCALDRAHIGLDFFDASINRVAAWVIGTRAAKKTLLRALLEPTGMLREAEAQGDLSARLALHEEAKTLPWGEVWEEFCRRDDVASERTWMDEVRAYERDVLSRR